MKIYLVILVLFITNPLAAQQRKDSLGIPKLKEFCSWVEQSGSLQFDSAVRSIGFVGNDTVRGTGAAAVFFWRYTSPISGDMISCISDPVFKNRYISFATVRFDLATFYREELISEGYKKIKCPGGEPGGTSNECYQKGDCHVKFFIVKKNDTLPGPMSKTSSPETMYFLSVTN